MLFLLYNSKQYTKMMHDLIKYGIKDCDGEQQARRILQRAAAWWKAVDTKAETHPGVANRSP